MEPNDLKTPEICFELLSRGIEPKANQTLRRAQLRGVLARERTGHIFPFPSTFTFSNEAKEIEVTLNELLSMSSVEENIVLSGLELRRLESRLNHVQRRCSLLSPIDDLEKEKLTHFDSLLLIISGFLIELKDNSLPTPGASSTFHSPTPLNASLPLTCNKPVPIHKWGIKFSGQSSKGSVMSFLEKVNDLCDARHISKEELFTSAIDLFEDTALLWFRNVKREVRTWPELVHCLKRDFLPVDYEDDLWNEIRSRTQGPSENVLIYIISVEAMFSRLSTRPPELEIIRQIRRNLNPYFAEKLVLTESQSLRHLKDVCRSVQELKTRTEKYQPPPVKKLGLLEPDLACLSLSDSPSITKSGAQVIDSSSNPTLSAIMCWNCHCTGHSHRECVAPKTIFCYKCGTPGNYSSSCASCISKNGLTGIVPVTTPNKTQPRRTIPPSKPNRSTSSIPLPPRNKLPLAASYVPQFNTGSPDETLRASENNN